MYCPGIRVADDARHPSVRIFEDDSMTNPWFSIPSADYEAHMESAVVQQTAMLRTELRKAVDRYRPRSLAILGVAGGSGLSELRDSSVETVNAVDLNPEYLAACRSRYGAESWSLETVQWDLSSSRPPIESVDLVFAALVIEYIDAASFEKYAPLLLRFQSDQIWIDRKTSGK